MKFYQEDQANHGVLLIKYVVIIYRTEKLLWIKIDGISGIDKVIQ